MWQKYKGKSDAIKGSSVRIRYSKILHISAPSDVHAEDNKSQTTPSIMGRFRQHHQGSFVSDTQSIPQSATVGTSYPHCTVAVGVLGLRAASDHCFAAYITSLLSSHELKLEILRKNAQECLQAVSGEITEMLQGKTGREPHKQR